MRVECPYCAKPVDVTSVASHVRSEESDGHGPHGTVPFDGIDSPWNLRLDVSPSAADEAGRGATEGESGIKEGTGAENDNNAPSVEVVERELRQGRCPNCEEGVLGLKGGDGLFSRGRRRLACPNCRWETPEWVRVSE